jgi:hypothetical protein
MLDLFNLPTPQGCNIQTFYGPFALNTTPSTNVIQKTWNKPRGVSFVYMLLIGAGGYNAGGGAAGASGSVTTWLGNANNIPDQLIVIAAAGGTASGQISTSVSSRQAAASSGLTPTTLLTAPSGIGSVANAAMNSNQFAASGFFQSVGGQTGSAGNPGASATTFLSAGGGAAVTANYGYAVLSGESGYFQLQPIIVGVGAGGSAGANSKPGYGCGGSSDAAGSSGGPGMVLIASW